MSGRLFLLDGTLLFFRALYGVPDVFRDERGRAINGVRGYLSYLLNLFKSQQVRHCAAAFDESLNSCWRNSVYPNYKANRPAADENINFQLDRCRRITGLLGIPVLADLEYEADDFIATFARRSRRAVVIVSRDKDLQQLLRHNVTLLDPAKNSVSDPETFRSTFGFEPELFPDYQALTGDSVDNIPGVRGVGPKSAGRLVGTFGSLEDIYAHEADWPTVGIKSGSKMATRMLEESERAFMFRRILRLDDQVPVSIPLTATRLVGPDRKVLVAALDGLGIGAGLGATLQRAIEAYGG